MKRNSTPTLETIGLAAAALILAGCGSGTAGQPDALSSANNAQVSDPYIANSAAASHRAARASAAAQPQKRTKGSVMGPGAPDTNGRADQERTPQR